MVQRRLVFQIAGYDPVSPARQHRRFARGLPVFAKTWNVTATASELSSPSADAAARWTVATRGVNWQVDAAFEPLCWDDIVSIDFERSMGQRLVLFGRAMLDLFGSGTALRYFKAQWKYGLFFLFPTLQLLGFAAAGLILGYLLGAALQLEGIAKTAVTVACGGAVFAVLLRWPGRRWRVLQALDDWIFSWDYLHRRRPDMEARLDRFARRLVEAAGKGNHDEILVVGHSLGATLAVNAVARALERDPMLAERGAPIALITVGSTIPKFTLHPAAAWVRSDIARVAASGVFWAEFHARADPISFYRFDPATSTKTSDRYDRQPVIRMTRLRNMLSKLAYRRIQTRFMRLHHQFVMANERRTNYDFYMMCCGPVPIRQNSMALDGPDGFFAADGSLLDASAKRPFENGGGADMDGAGRVR